jgi:MFS family permease
MKYRALLRTTYLAGFLFSFHVALTVYVNSSYLSTKIPEALVGTLYTASAVIAIIGLYAIPRLMNRFGSRAILGTLVGINIANIIAMIVSHNVAVISACFAIFFAFNTLIYLGFDILIESWSENAVQGTVRGSYLTANNIGYMFAPLIAGFIADRLGFGTLYGFAIALSLPVLILLIGRLPSITNTHPSKSNILSLAHKFSRHKELRSVFLINFILQFFYAWMVIYTPLYLHEQAGLSWDRIGILFSIMLSAFVIFQYIAGKMADRFHCEKWMMAAGLFIMGVATLLVMRAPGMTFWTLALVLFITRVGASIVEVMTESYFFKRVHHDDTGAIGFFRNTYPFAYILAPLLASLILEFAPMWTLFAILGTLCCVAVFITTDIVSVKK